MPATLLLTLLLAVDPQSTEGIRPVKADGTVLNLDFEKGTLDDWTIEGDAFAGQPIKGDAVAARRGDMKSNHQGEYWIGGYELKQDKAQGTLTSVPFKVTHPWASFLIGGGHWPETRVEVLAGDVVIFKAHGADTETMHRVAVDLGKYLGQEIKVRLVDRQTGAWGHVNFDDFRFHTDKPVVEVKAAALNINQLKYAGLKPEEAAKAMTVPEGFTVSLFAGEPDVHQPVAFCFDDRGRLWVAEAFTYPIRHAHPGPILPEKDKAKGDKILIFEDTDGDGKFDKRTVFLEGLNLVSGIEYGFGGLYIGAAPYLLHVPIKDDKPAGEPVVLLDGWGYEDTHETLNSFIWGPDGWLYGCHGVFTKSRVGKPGTPDKERIPINAGYWRYHPTRKVFERFAEGTSNPWGLDYNQFGDFFSSCCVIPHLFHIVQGGRYIRQAGQHFNPHTSIEIGTIADHQHYQGNQWNNADRGKSSDLGGGHAHCGLMCYQGGAWPKEYHGQLFMGNIHGRRINMDIPTPKGSTYTASHGKDFLLANDAWARFIAIKYGPDGNAFVIDWYDEQACHRREPEVWDRSNGRIYKISYRGTKPVTNLDLQKCADEELVKYQTHENEWYVQRARRILQERHTGNPNLPERAKLETLLSRKVIRDQVDGKNKLRLLWARHVVEIDHYTKVEDIVQNDTTPHFRGWVVNLATQWHYVLKPGHNPVKKTSDIIGMALNVLNEDDQVPLAPADLRRVASSVTMIPADMQLLTPDFVRQCIRGTMIDHTLKCLFWYFSEPNCVKSRTKNAMGDWDGHDELFILGLSKLVMQDDADFITLVNLASRTRNAERKVAFLEAFLRSQRRKKSDVFKDEWQKVRQQFQNDGNPSLRRAALLIDVVLGDPEAIEVVRKVWADEKAQTSDRVESLQLLIEIRDKKLPGLFEISLKDPALRLTALRGIAAQGQLDSAKAILGAFTTFDTKEKREAIAALASKPAFAMALLTAIETKAIPATDVPAETIRQLRTFNDKALNAKVEAVWGVVRDTPADRKQLIARWKPKLNVAVDADLSAGRAVFAKTCQQCHTLYGVGGSVGPDITGSNRADLNYLLENIFDPSAVIPKDYAASTFDLSDGRKVTGIVKVDGPQISVQTATEIVRFNATDVEKRVASGLSMMPDDITKQASETEIKNLFAYLRSPQQVPMKATPENAKDFFNGKDLTGWDGDKDVWSVDNGEIVGKSATGLKKNNFLKSTMEAGDFKLSLKVKLLPNKENSGIQFRSVPHLGHEMKGPQADIGAGWWGKLYEESGRGLLVKEGGEKHVKVDDWNEYVIEAKGPTVKMWINGEAVADYTDDKLAKRGLFAVQVHSGGPMEVRFKDLKLEVLEEIK